MRSTTAEPDPMKSYIPICQSFAPIVFPDLQDLTLSSSAQKKDIRDVLVKSCRIATAEYENIKLRKSMLPDTVALFEELGEGMARYVYPVKSLLNLLTNNTGRTGKSSPNRIQ